MVSRDKILAELGSAREQGELLLLWAAHSCALGVVVPLLHSSRRHVPVRLHVHHTLVVVVGDQVDSSRNVAATFFGLCQLLYTYVDGLGHSSHRSRAHSSVCCCRPKKAEASSSRSTPESYRKTLLILIPL